MPYSNKTGSCLRLQKPRQDPLTVGDMNLIQSDRGIAHQLIVDGHVSSYNLSLVGKTEIWLKKRIKAYGFESFKDVYLFTLDDAGGEYILKKINKERMSIYAKTCMLFSVIAISEMSTDVCVCKTLDCKDARR